jgi:DNA replication factor GINS
MNLEEIWNSLDRERSKSELQELHTDFYDEIRTYIMELEEEKKDVKNERKAMLIEDELRTIRKETERIFHRRMEKIAKLATLATSTSIEGESILPEEREIFESIRDSIEKGKRKLEVVLQGGARKKNTSEDFFVVRMLRDVPTFVGTDGRNYTVGKEDIITLPEDNAEILCRRGAALRVKNKNENTKKIQDILPILQQTHSTQA